MIFLIELNFLKGDTNIYFEQIIKKKKKKDFVKIIHIFFKNIIFLKLGFATFYEKEE